MDGGGAVDQSTTLIFIAIFYVLILIPCVGVGWVGWNLINQLGRFPSKTPAIQMGIIFKLVVVELVSFTLILAFFKVLSVK
jgi:hypothetical protein